jgi:hypothetical protein
MINKLNNKGLERDNTTRSLILQESTKNAENFILLHKQTTAQSQVFGRAMNNIQQFMKETAGFQGEDITMEIQNASLRAQQQEIHLRHQLENTRLQMNNVSFLKMENQQV